MQLHNREAAASRKRWPRRQRVLFGFRAIFIGAGIALTVAVGGHLIARADLSHAVLATFRSVFKFGDALPVEDIRQTITAKFQQKDFSDFILEFDANRARWLTPGPLMITHLDNARNEVTIRVTINAEGFRGKDAVVEAPPGTTRIIAIGDSHVYGFSLADHETLCVQLEQRLGDGFEVFNMGIPGANMIQKFDMLQSKAIAYDPDLVILQYNWGDDHLPEEFSAWREEVFEELIDQYELRREEYGLRIMKLLHSVTEQFIERIGWQRLHRSMVDTPLLSFIKMSKTHDFQLIVIASDYPPSEEEASMKGILAGYHIPYVGITEDVFAGRLYSISEYEPHYNRRGHALITEWLYRTIVNL